MTICTLCVEIDATYSDPPIRIKLLGLRSSQGHPQFKNGTVYRQVRPRYAAQIGSTLTGLRRTHAADLGNVGLILLVSILGPR